MRQLRRGVTVTEIDQRAQEQLRELLNLSEAACQAVAQQNILNALAFSDMYGRFEVVEKAHFNTFGWIYGDKPSPKADSDEDSSTEHQPQHEDNADTLSQRSRSKEAEDIDFDESNNGGLKKSQDSVNEERKEREISPSTVPEKQHQKDNQSDKDDASAQREKWTNWLSSGNGIFHIAGKLGSGKSTLMKFLCNHPQTKVALQKWAGMFKLDEK